MDLHLSGKTALVTGASTSGCGRAIAMALAREGVAVAIAAHRPESLKQLAREIKTGGYIEPVTGQIVAHDPVGEARRELAH